MFYDRADIWLRVPERRPYASRERCEASLAGLKPAERRVLKFIAGKTSSWEWFPVPGRSIVKECHVSWRDMTPLLKRLAKRGLIRVRSNKYAVKRTTQIALRVHPSNLSRRLVDDVNIVMENGSTPL
jgi:DNA-binding MarR family transcriptional regulator